MPTVGTNFCERTEKPAQPLLKPTLKSANNTTVAPKLKVAASSHERASWNLARILGPCWTLLHTPSEATMGVRLLQSNADEFLWKQSRAADVQTWWRICNLWVSQGSLSRAWSSSILPSSKGHALHPSLCRWSPLCAATAYLTGHEL